MSNIEQELIREFGTATFADHDPEHKSLGWQRGPVDERDLRTEDAVTLERDHGLQHWLNPIQLDQGVEGSCVGFGTTGVINAAPQPHGYGYTFAYDLYKYAQTLDPWPGTDYEGTSVRAGAQAAKNRGYFAAYAMTYDVEVLARYILNHGPATIGVDWYTGMDRVDPEGYIYPTGSVRGGHCVVIDGVVWGMDGEDDRFRIRNSWGGSWGLNGRCRIRGGDLQYLIGQGGVACTPVETPPGLPTGEAA